jgi:hypothetical protein
LRGPQSVVAFAGNAEQEEQVMNKQLLVGLGSDDRSLKFMPSVKPVIQSGLRINLLRTIAMLSRYVRRKHGGQTEEIYTPRKSHKEESGLEFQRFLYW